MEQQLVVALPSLLLPPSPISSYFPSLAAGTRRHEELLEELLEAGALAAGSVPPSPLS